MTAEPLNQIEHALQRLGKTYKRHDRQIVAQCPAHDDNKPSFSAAPGTKGRDVVLYCYAGCRPDDIMHALNLEWTDFGNPTHQQPLDQWIYKDANGRPLYRVVKNPGKQFRQHAYDPATGEWLHRLGDIDRVPYRLPDILAAITNGETIWIAEGEKDVDALVAHGAQATCNPGGAGKFTTNIARHLKGARHVTIVADRDDPGVNHAKDVAGTLLVLGIPTNIVQAAEGKDAYDHFAFGHALDDFVPLESPDNTPDAEVWPDPIPLAPPRAPEWPTGVLPDFLEDMVAGVADELQTTRDLPAMIGIGLLAVIYGGHATIRVRGTWREQLCLYVITAMPPSAGKSPAFSLMKAPIEAWLEGERERMAPEIAKAEQTRRIIESDMARAEKKGERAEAATFLDELAQTPVPPLPQLWTDDATPEAFVRRMYEHNGRMSVMSTEGGVFQLIGGRYADQVANLDPYLKAWSGDTIIVDRLGRESFTINKPVASMVLTVQPSVLQQVGADGDNRNRGLTARFMMSIPHNNIGRRNLIDGPTLSDDVADRYHDAMTKLIDAAQHIGGKELRLSESAQRGFLMWRQSLEQRRADDLEPLAEWSTKLESSVARLAGILHLVGENSPDDPVSDATMARAIAVGNYWIGHAKLAHDLWDASSGLSNARAILDWMMSQRVAETTVRDIMRANRRRFKTVDDVVTAVEMLVDNGWIRSDAPDGSIRAPRKGSDSPCLRIHPQCLESVDNSPHVGHVNHVPNKEFEAFLSLSLKSAPEAGDTGHKGHGGHVETSTAQPVDNRPAIERYMG